jgi:uncharacterized protein DUF6632
MVDRTREKQLSAAMIVVGLIFLVGIYPMTLIWPSGWVWHDGGQSNYFQMIVGVYATLGVFLLMGARKPMENLSLVWFTVWSSIVHAGIMAVQAINGGAHDRGHLFGDVPALLIVAVLFTVVTPRRSPAPSAPARV